MTNHESLLRTWLKLHIPLIDLRSHQQFIKLHLLDSTNIPVSQLSDRAHELPPKKSELCILGSEEEINEGKEYLAKHDYVVMLALRDDVQFWTVAKEHQLVVENSSISQMIWKPSPCLEEVIEIIEMKRHEMGLSRQGIALDLACGSGRDLVFLALRGWTSIGFDYSESAKIRALNLAQQCEVPIVFHCLDIEKFYHEILTMYHCKADIVNISRYLNRNLIGFIKELIKPGGFIVFHTFMEGCSKPRKKKFLLAKGELAQLFSDFKILEDKVISLLDGRPTSFFLGQKPHIPV